MILMTIFVYALHKPLDMMYFCYKLQIVFDFTMLGWASLSVQKYSKKRRPWKIESYKMNVTL